MKYRDLVPPQPSLMGHIGIEPERLINIFYPSDSVFTTFSRKGKSLESEFYTEMEDARMFRKLEERGIPPFIPEREILEQF